MKFISKIVIILGLAVGAFARTSIHGSIMGNWEDWEGPECPVADPLKLVRVPINATFDPIIKLLAGSNLKKLVVNGLSTVRYKVEVNPLTLNFSYDITIPRVSGKAKYTADGYLDARPFRQETIPSGNFTGSGLAKFSAANFRITGNGAIFLNLRGKVQFSRLVLHDASFDSLELDLGPKFRIGGRRVNWREFNRNIKSNFDRDFAESKGAIGDRVKEAANILLAEFKLPDIIIPGPDPPMCD